MLNEAALLTARQNQKLITDDALDEAIDRVIAGPQRRTRLMSEKEKLITAYHEGGHALVAAALPGSDPVHKITILPRGRALGYTMVLPDEDKYSQTRSELLDKLAYMMGGRAAEEMVFHDPTTGAGNDIEKATNLARAMVTQYGMTERSARSSSARPTPSRSWAATSATPRNYSEDVAAIVDEEIKKLLADAHQEAFDILVENRDVLDALVLELLDKETLDKDEVAEVFEPLRRRAGASRVDRLAGPGPVERSRRSRSRRQIRDRVNGNGPLGAEEGEGGVVITPPGAGGDVHGDPGLRRAGPASPAPADGAHDRPDQPTTAARRRSRRSTTPRPRPRSASCWSRSARTPSVRACSDTPARVARAYAELTAGLRQRAGGRAHHHLRPRPRRDGAGPRHRAVVDVRAPPGAVHRRRPRRLHPGRERQDHRPVQAGPAGRRLRQAAAGAGAADHPGRRRADGASSRPAASSS